MLAAVLEPSRANLVRSALATQIARTGRRCDRGAGGRRRRIRRACRSLRRVSVAWRTRGFAVMYRRLIADEGVVARTARAQRRRAADDEPARISASSCRRPRPPGMAPDALLRWLATAAQRARARRRARAAARVRPQPRAHRHDPQGEGARVPVRVLPVLLRRRLLAAAAATCASTTKAAMRSSTSRRRTRTIRRRAASTRRSSSRRPPSGCGSSTWR